MRYGMSRRGGIVRLHLPYANVRGSMAEAQVASQVKIMLIILWGPSRASHQVPRELRRRGIVCRECGGWLCRSWGS
jgi:hypothetical protein